MGNTVILYFFPLEIIFFLLLFEPGNIQIVLDLQPMQLNPKRLSLSETVVRSLLLRFTTSLATVAKGIIGVVTLVTG